MKYKVDGWNNFCRVFELPVSYPEDFCFGGGHAVMMTMVDWFNPVPDVSMAGCSKEVWEKEVGPIEVVETDLDELAATMVPWVRQKGYIKPDREYLIIFNFGASIIFPGVDHASG